MLEPQMKPKLEPEIQVILEKVVQQCKIESEKGSLQIPIREYKERAAYYTGVPSHYIDGVDTNEPSINNIHFNLDIQTVICIYKVMRDFYKCSKFPTIQEVYNKTKLDLQRIIIKFGYTLAEFKTIMTQLGFEYRPTTTRGLLMEDPKETFERYNFLTFMHTMRNMNLPIYYIDVRIIDQSLKFPKLQKVTELSNTNSYTYFHMVSRSQLLNGLFCYNVKEQDFLKWLTDIVLPLLKGKCVFVLDNSPLHRKLSSDKITRYHPKADMLKWLKDHNIPCKGSMHKAELYYLIENSCHKTNNFYNTDQTIRAYGHTVIHLPRALDDLSPTDIFWKKLENLMREQTTMKDLSNLINIKNCVTETISLIAGSHHKKNDDDIAALEKELCSIDIDVDNALEKYNIMIPVEKEEKRTDLMPQLNAGNVNFALM